MAKSPKPADAAVAETPAPEAPAVASVEGDARTQLEMKVGSEALKKWQAEQPAGE